MKREETEKKNKRLGWILTSVFHVMLVALLFAFGLPVPEPMPEPALVLDFTAGSTSSGGSSSAPSESEEATEDPVVETDPVLTQDKPTTVKKSDKKKNDKSTPNKNPTKQSNPDASAKNPFGGDGNSKGKNKGDDEDNDGLDGKGKNGAGAKGKTGNLGADEGIAPKVVNPTKDQEGVVMIELTVNRAGEVIDVKVLSTHAKTTTSDLTLQNYAKKMGFKFEFEPDSKRAEFAKGTRGVNFTLN